MKSIVLISLLSLSGWVLGADQCILPVADGGELDPVPASIKGIIASVTESELTVEGREPLKIRLNEKTEMFTVYGGAVDPEELKPGLHAFIWFLGCKAESKTSATAAVIQVCATKPVPCL